MANLIRPRSAIWALGARTDLIEGTYYPDASNTGLITDPSTLTLQNANITYSTPGQIIENVDFNCRVSVSAANVRFNNCRFRGDNSVNAVVTLTNAGAANVQFWDCEIYSQFENLSRNTIGGDKGKFYRCNIHHGVDLMQVQNSSLYASLGDNWPCTTEFRQCYLHDMLWLTAASGGTVHPTDTETHNDIFQLLGGSGFIAIGNTLDARFARQAGHWVVTNPAAEPYTTVPLNSLPNGGPWQNIPERGVTGGPSRLSGTEADGRYNWDDLAGLMLTAQQGPITNITFKKNLCRGGNYFANGGGNPYSSGLFLGDFEENAFIADQGDYQSTLGGENGHTLNFGGTWSGNVNAPTTGALRNFYLASGNPITVRP